MTVKWKEKYSVGVREIDDQHKRFINLLNALIDALQKKESLDRLKNLFYELADYAEEHFATEEKYFDKFKYNEASEHKLKHKDMLEDIDDIKSMKDKDQIDFNESVIFFLTEWLEDHLENDDQKYKECFIKNGLT